jgi:hypothetical protein
MDDLRSAIARAIAERTRETGAELTMSPERLATCVIALANGLAAEGLIRDLDSPQELYADALAGLFAGVAA